MKTFQDQVVWITGASSGIGRALARAFAEQGAIVCLSARREDRLADLVNELTNKSLRAFAYACDVTKEEQLASTVEAIVASHGKLDCAVANAGYAVRGRIESLTAQDWRNQLEVNVIGLAMTAKYALTELRRTNGRMVLIGSVMSMMCSAKSGAYSASKYAVRAIGQTLSLELHGSGVTCTTIHPGLVESEIAMVDNAGVWHKDRHDKRPAKWMWSADKAAMAIVRATAKRKREYVFTNHAKLGGYLGRHFPGALHFALSRGT